MLCAAVLCMRAKRLAPVYLAVGLLEAHPSRPKAKCRTPEIALKQCNTDTAPSLAELIKRVDESCTAFGMEISAEKTKVMINSHVKDSNLEFKVKNSVLEVVDKFIYLGATVTDNGSKSEILSRIA